MVEGIGKRHVLTLLLSRIIALCYMLESSTPLTPYQWLLLQIQPQKILGEDIFVTLYEILRRCTPQLLEDKVLELSASLYGTLGYNVLVVGDEMQTLLNACINKFSSHTTKQIKTRPLFSKLIYQWTLSPHLTLIILGTGFEL